jgi:hypothetical protein
MFRNYLPSKGSKVNLKNLVRSAVTTFATAFLSLVPLSALVSNDFSWVQSALISAALTALRTAIAFLDPGNTSFGFGSQEVVQMDEPQPDAPTEG